jgi:hypothetical protein
LYPNQNQPNQTINNGIPAQLSHTLFPMFPFSHNPSYPKIEPQDGNPYIIYSPISTNPLVVIDGWAGHKQIRMQIDVYADTLTEAEEISNDLIPILEALTTISVEVVDGGTGSFEQDTRLFRQTTEFLIWEQTL